MITMSFIVELYLLETERSDERYSISSPRIGRSVVLRHECSCACLTRSGGVVSGSLTMGARVTL